MQTKFIELGLFYLLVQVSLGKLLFHRGLSEFLNIETEFLNIENIFTIQRSYETPRQGGTGLDGTHGHVEG